MSDFQTRLKFAISNYAAGAISYKSFAALIDLPYRTLQNYLSGERSPNLDALQKISKSGININWLITGHGSAFNFAELERELIDIVFMLHAREILRTAFKDKGEIYSERQRDRLLTFVISNNYLRIGDIIKAMQDEGAYPAPGALDEALASGELEEYFDRPPTTARELWKARQLLKETKSRDIVTPNSLSVEGEEVGQ